MTDPWAAFLVARLDEREARARKLLDVARKARETNSEPWMLGRQSPGWHSWPDVEAMCEQALREVAAKRAMLDRHRPVVAAGARRQSCWHDGQYWPCADVMGLASVESDHPDYAALAAAA